MSIPCESTPRRSVRTISPAVMSARSFGIFMAISARVMNSVSVVGWTSVATLILIIGGIQLLMLGIFGEYLGRLYMEAKRRPLFVVDSVLCVSTDAVDSYPISALASSDAGAAERAAAA